MAANSHRGGSKLSVQPEEIRQQYAECTSCLKEYNDNVNVPQVLPCLHALCKSCVTTTSSRGTIKCPTCDIRHTVPADDPEKFPVDETRQFLVNYMKVQRKNPDIVCQECNNKNKVAKQRCRECAQFLCIDCVDAHKRTKVTKKHNIINLEDLRDATMEEFLRPQNCKHAGHEEQPNAFYCTSESCDHPVCALCAVTDHPESKGHIIRDIHEVYTDIKRSVEGLMSDVKHRALSAQDTASTIESTLDHLDSNLTNTTSNIDIAFDSCVKALERRRVELKDAAHSRVKEKKKRLETQLESINYHINCLEDANEFTTYITTYGNQSEFLFNKDTIIQRLNNLRDEEFDTIPHDNEEMKFKTSKMGEDFSCYVRDMGEVWTTSAYGPNTHVDVRDITVDREQTILDITLFDSEGLQQEEGGVDVRVDVTDPSGRRRQANVVDSMMTSGRYKAVYMATSKGKHRATVYIYGTPMPNDHVFRAQSPHHVEKLNLRGGGEKYQSTEIHVNAKDDLNSTRRLQTATPSDISDSMSPIADQVLGDVICPGFVFDATTSNVQIDIMEEGKTMRGKSNKGGTTRRSTRDRGRFGLFRGAMGSRPFQKAGLYYFEVGVVYKIHTLIRQEQVFEVGLSKLESIDRNPSVDCHPYAWTVCARGCHVCGKVCLQTWHNGQLLSHTPVSARTKSPPGTFVRLYYGFLLDAERRHWIVIDVKSKKLIFRFKNLVVSEMSEPLWPVFSVSNPDVVSTALTLKTGRAIDTVPEEALDALVP